MFFVELRIPVLGNASGLDNDVFAGYDLSSRDLWSVDVLDEPIIFNMTSHVLGWVPRLFFHRSYIFVCLWPCVLFLVG